MGAQQKVLKGSVLKVDETYGIVVGWAITCTKDGEPYYDLNVDRDGAYKGQHVPEHIPEGEMFKAALDFAEQSSRPGNEMHVGANKGEYVFLFPLTADIAKALEIETKFTGLLVGFKPPEDVLEKFRTGEYTGFSIEGWHEDSELVDA